MPTNILTVLQKAVTGLQYPSETDAPFEPFVWPTPGDKITKDLVLARAVKPNNTPVEKISLANFFEPLTEPKSWHRPAEKADLKKFRNLQKVLEENLTDIVVFRIDKTQVAIYVVGKTSTGDWAGVSTQSVET